MIRIENISKSFYKNGAVTDAVRGMNFTVAREEIVAIIGPSGCGKSTLLNMIAGLYAPTHGTIIYNGTAVSGVNPAVGTRTKKDSGRPGRRVRDNGLFPLERPGIPPPARARRAEDVI